MMKEILENDDSPPSYTNSGFDGEPTPGPSAPEVDEEGEIDEVYTEPVPEPSAPPPKYEEGAGPSYEVPGVHRKVPTAPASEMNMDSRTLQYTSPSLVFEEIYEACIHYVKSHCCYSSRFARKMKLTEINNGCAFHYSLESIGEKRTSAKKFIPYKGGPIDGPSNGQPPSAWDMQVGLPTLFQDAKTQLIIPHTDYVETCSKCGGRGKVTCSSCNGRGRNRCFSCSGSGRRQNERCTSCSGRGHNTCFRCGASGRVTCSRCKGYGKIKNFKILMVTWTNHPIDFVSNICSLPVKKIRKATGDMLLSDERNKLSPIWNAPDDSVNTASVRLLEAHRNSFPDEMIRKQRHSLRAVPFTTAKYKFKEEEGEFYIYGKEKAVYFESYPTNCCCICC